jgi:hypothetical protein
MSGNPAAAAMAFAGSAIAAPHCAIGIAPGGTTSIANRFAFRAWGTAADTLRTAGSSRRRARVARQYLVRTPDGFEQVSDGGSLGRSFPVEASQEWDVVAASGQGLEGGVDPARKHGGPFGVRL